MIDQLLWGLEPDNAWEVLVLTGQHLRFTLVALGIALAIALPVGIVVAPRRWLDVPVLGLLGVLYVVPSLALLALLIVVVGLGVENLVIVLVVYAQVILVRNVVAGLRGVDPTVREAARGMGMTRLQRLRRVELPLALPVIVAGLRVATVVTIAIGTFGGWIDAGGLGEILFEGLATFHNGKILAGGVAASLLALGLNLALGRLERRMRQAVGGG